MKDFSTEFNTLSYIIKNSKRILLFAHSNPDGDTAGSVFAFKEYLESIGKIVDAGCTGTDAQALLVKIRPAMVTNFLTEDEMFIVTFSLK